MTWAKLDDNWTRKIRALRLTLPARWHYLEMIEFICASEAYDEPMAASDARTCSDMDDPIACLAELEEKGLVTRDMNGDYLVTRIDEHTYLLLPAVLTWRPGRSSRASTATTRRATAGASTTPPLSSWVGFPTTLRWNTQIGEGGRHPCRLPQRLR